MTNTIWVYAKLQITPPDSLMTAISASVLKCAHAFIAQNASIVIWAYATLNEPPPEPVMAALATTVERCINDFLPQAISNALWAHAALAIKPHPLLLQRVRGLYASELNNTELSQLWYAHLVGKSLGWDFELTAELTERAEVQVKSLARETTVSGTQRSVRLCLVGMGLTPKLETKTVDGYFSIDVSLLAEDGVTKIAIQVDGPYHYTSTRRRTGNTRLRDHLLEERGWRVVSMPFYDIDSSPTDAALVDYCKKKLVSYFPSLLGRDSAAAVASTAAATGDGDGDGDGTAQEQSEADAEDPSRAVSTSPDDVQLQGLGKRTREGAVGKEKQGGEGAKGAKDARRQDPRKR